MQWIILPEIESGTVKEHWFAYCWNHERDIFVPGIPLTHQLYLNPFIHTEPICEACARRCDPDFGKGSVLELINGVIHISKGSEPECPHPGEKSFYSILPSRKVVIACSRECAKEMVAQEESNWETFCERIGL